MPCCIWQATSIMVEEWLTIGIEFAYCRSWKSIITRQCWTNRNMSSHHRRYISCLPMEIVNLTWSTFKAYPISRTLKYSVCTRTLTSLTRINSRLRSWRQSFLFNLESVVRPVASHPIKLSSRWLSSSWLKFLLYLLKAKAISNISSPMRKATCTLYPLCFCRKWLSLII